MNKIEKGLEEVRNSLQSLASIKKVDDYGMFQMTYFGDYGFDDYLKVGTNFDEEIDTTYNPIPGSACTMFVTRNDKGEVLVGRNMDFYHAGNDVSPSLQVKTNPDNGYSSVSTINLIFAGYSKDNLPSGLDLNSVDTLVAPYMPMDGMNEKGVTIGIVAVPQAQAPSDKNKVTINSLDLVRLVLDKAENVAQAIELMKQYNVYFPYGITCQYLIADSSGRSVIVNFADGEAIVTEVDENYQICSNFAACNPGNREGGCEFERYDKVKDCIERNGGSLTDAQAVDLLTEVGGYNRNAETGDKFDILQWSAVYNLTTLDGVIFANRKKDSLINFSLN